MKKEKNDYKGFKIDLHFDLDPFVFKYIVDYAYNSGLIGKYKPLVDRPDTNTIVKMVLEKKVNDFLDMVRYFLELEGNEYETELEK